VLSQPPNRTPRSWQKAQERDEAERSADAATPWNDRHRPGWLSARLPPSGHNTPRVQSARARRLPAWNSGADLIGSTVNSVLSRLGSIGGPGGHNKRVAVLEQIQKDQELQARQEVRAVRDKLFENPKRRFTKREMEHFCQKLLGNDDIQQMQKICSKAYEDRSHEDCTFLCKMLGKCSFLQQNLSMPRMLCAARCVQALSLAPGEDLHVSDKTPQIFILVQGLMAEPTSGDLVKQGDYVLRMPNMPKSHIFSDTKWSHSKPKIMLAGGTADGGKKKTGASNQKKSSTGMSVQSMSSHPGAHTTLLDATLLDANAHSQLSPQIVSALQNADNTHSESIPLVCA